MLSHPMKIIGASLLIVALAVVFAFHHFRPSSPSMRLDKTTFNRLHGWNQDNLALAFTAFKQSCTEILKRQPDQPFGPPQAASVRDWQTICYAANRLKTINMITARQFFENWFEPYLVKNGSSTQGLFTGYYLPLLFVNLQKNGQYTVPIYGLPNDLVQVNLGEFQPAFKGKSIVGQLKNHRLRPYPDRQAIETGAIDGKAKVLFWSNNAIDVFFAQIQGSAMVQLPNHQQLLIGYAGHNGRPYTAIGSVLVANHALDKQHLSMDAIRAWLTEHPDQTQPVLNHNASYVFFKVLKGHDPLGTEHVPLTTGRSLAVDKRYLPLGAPIWLETDRPLYPSKEATVPLRQLFIAQDTGGAINGIVRGDVYWGAGEKAAFVAGHMKSIGQYWILLPKKLSK
ncbi:murein transglycosylase A [Aquicella lusitana]|uniref:Membrane-bound lytic murein transglycosylase A n=1 Tax=Aquicella lusitana TaxID=254246 RepID=A0A370GFS3_9COXI|nr:MltA domain-containing protein [Aquicella lusitana]RDI42056.1 membrane-bound lytic murein transglycosylase A [Aquicella lusitana]VVC74437.1 Membrane-bound lytic murein transglycosylase A [Aquicella lusitana]